MNITKTILYVIVLMMISNCGSNDPEIVPDSDAPIISVSISDGTIDVSLDANIVISLTEPVFDTEGNIVNTVSAKAFITLREDNFDGPDVPFKVMVNASAQTITVDPVDKLIPGKQYHLHIESFRDEAGNAANPVTIIFTTEAVDFSNLLTKWSVTTEVLSTFDHNGNLIFGNLVTEFPINENTFEFEGNVGSGTFRRIIADEAFWVVANYTTNVADTSVTLEVINSSFPTDHISTIKLINFETETAEFFIATEVTENGTTVREERSLSLVKNDNAIPIITITELFGEWSAISLSDSKFLEKDAGSNEFRLEYNYTLDHVPHDRITYNFSSDKALLIDTYYTGNWHSGDIQMLDGSNLLLGGKYAHLKSRTGDNEMTLVVTNIEDDVSNIPDVKFQTEYQFTRNDGSQFTTTEDSLIGEWLITEATEWEDGIDVTDPNSEDSALGMLITFNENRTGTVSGDGSSESLNYTLLDGNSFELVIVGTDQQVIIFHIINLVVDGTTNEFKIVAGRVEEENCESNCELKRFEFELVLEKQN